MLTPSLYTQMIALGVLFLALPNTTIAQAGGERVEIRDLSGSFAGDRLGTSVSGAGDVNNDGLEDYIVGVPLSDLAGTDTGHASVYSGTDGSLLYTKFGISSAFGFNHTGQSVSGAGDVNGDGFDDLIVGSTFANGTGSATLYSGSTGSVIREYFGEGSGDTFESSVSGGSDVDGDGIPDVLIGAPGAAANGVANAGVTYLYSGATGNLLDRIEGTEASGNFGASVSVIPDSNGDGKADYLCGAPGNSPGALSEAGTCHVSGFEPFLIPSSYTIPASVGATIQLEMDFPDTAAGHEYRLIVSGQGMGPTFFGVDIPITVDSLVMQTYAGSYPFPSSANLQGTLDLDGNASSSFGAPPGLPAHFHGQTFWFVVLAIPAGLAPSHASIAIPIIIVP